MQGAFGEGDGESAEIRQLLGAVSLGDYLDARQRGESASRAGRVN